MTESLHILLGTSACLQWLCHSGERTVARGPLVFYYCPFQGGYSNADSSCCKTSIVVTGCPTALPLFSDLSQRTTKPTVRPV